MRIVTARFLSTLLLGTIATACTQNDDGDLPAPGAQPDSGADSISLDDASSSYEAGSVDDTGRSAADASADSGSGSDATASVDSGTVIDSGTSPEAGTPVDASPPTDAGSPVDSASATAYCTGPAGWSSIAAAPFAPWSSNSSGNLTAWTGKEMLLFGGTVAAAYDPATNTWRSLPAPPFPETTTVFSNLGGAVFTGSKWIIWTDAWGSGVGRFVGMAYDVASNTWTTIADAPYTGMANRAPVWSSTTSEMLVFEERARTGVGIGEPIGMAYAPTTNTWRVLAAPPFLGAGTTLAWTGTRALLASPAENAPGVESDTSPSELAAVFDPVTNTWTTLTAPTGPGRFFAAPESLSGGGAALVGGRFGYGDGGPYDPARDVLVFDDATWTLRLGPPVSDAMYAGRYRTGAAHWTANGKVFVQGGGGCKSPVVYTEGSCVTELNADGVVYDPVASTWTALPTGGPAGFSIQTVWTGCAAILVGGSASRADGGYDRVASGMIYRP